MATTKKTEDKKGMSTNKKVLIGTGIFLGLASVVGTIFYFNNKSKNKQSDETTPPAPPTSTTTAPSTTTMPEGVFPLIFGAYSRKVKRTQEALIALGGEIARFITTTGGADGKLGNGTKSAIEKAGYSLPFTQTMYDKLIARIGGSSYTPTSSPAAKHTDWATRLYTAIIGFGTNMQNIEAVFTEMTSKDDYMLTGQVYLSRYAETLSKALRGEYLFMNNIIKMRALLDGKGIVHDLNPYNLTGLGDLEKLVPIQGGLVRANATGIKVWNDKGKTLPVSPNMILGTEISKDTKNNVSAILTNDNVVIFAPSSALTKA